jgi:hypothetical protein
LACSMIDALRLPQARPIELAAAKSDRSQVGRDVDAIKSGIDRARKTPPMARVDMAPMAPSD